ncbi:hypothetical protein RND81_04G240700 [Saponaria officinalis]|uniref:Integrator complex subunit 3 n=1 Tax=Saponaria officinalis TaxID=3572 RepID=A0AAW1LLE0_SAPOF
MIMASKLISLSPHEAQIQLEVSLREAYCINQSKLTPPLKYTILSNEEYLSINKAVVYGVLCEPNLANIYIKYLHAHVNDGYCLFIDIIVQIIDGLYLKLLEFPKIQLFWVISVMVDVSGVGFDRLFVSILRRIVGGDFSDGNLWLSCEVVNLLSLKWGSILDEAPFVLGYGLYTYLRLLSDHYRLSRSSRSTELKQKEIGFCVRVLREQFRLCVGIGRDLIRVLQDLVHIPEFRAIWRDLLMNPSSFGVSNFLDISEIYRIRTSSRYFLLRITPEMETQLRFLLTHVKLGAQRRHQAWFARKFLFGPERESIISDIVRFVCCAHHPSNEVLQSEVIPRWAVIGWLLKSCTKKYVEANVKLALFYDWLFFDEKVDNFMNVEPAMLLMVNSIPKYVDLTNSLLEFLLLLVENYDIDRKNVVLKGVSSALSMLVRKGVIASLDVLTTCNLLSPCVKKLLQNFMQKVESVVLSEPQLSATSSLKVPFLPSPNTSCMEIQQHLPDILPAQPVKAGLTSQQNSVSDSIESAASPVIDNVDQVEDVGYLIGKIGDSMKKSSTMGQEIVERIIFLCTRDSSEKLSEMSSEFLAHQIKCELELAGYKLFSPLENLLDSGDVDDEVQSVTATIICAFIFTQHQRIRDMLCCWSKDGCLVGVRLLSYALRLAYEAHEVGYGASSSDEIKTILPLLKCHNDRYFAFMPRKGENIDATMPSDFNDDKEVISKMIDDAYTAYKSFASSEEFPTSPGKLLSIHAMACSLWKNKKFKFVFRDIFSYLSDLSLGDEDLIQLLVSQLEDADVLSMQIDLGLKRYALFGEDVQNALQLIKKSVDWKQADQHKFWGLATSELIVSEFPVEKLLLCWFFSDDLNPTSSGTAFSGLMKMCNSHAPTPEIVGAVMLLPNNKFPDFAAAALSHWACVNQAMLSNSLADFLTKFENKNGVAAFDCDGIVLNKSAVVFLFNYLEAQGGLGNIMLEKLGLNLSDIRPNPENSAISMDTG